MKAYESSSFYKSVYKVAFETQKEVNRLNEVIS